MNREDIIRMAREAGIIHPEMVDKTLERFAALVIANHPPQSYMTWQEGYEAGKQTEREKFCATLRQLHDSYSLASDSNAIRARGQA